MHTTQDFTSFNDLAAKVGEFLFYWSSFEQTLTRTIQQEQTRQECVRRSLPKDFDARIALWKSLVARCPENQANLDVADEVSDQCQAIRKVRNIIVHGLAAADGRPDDGRPHIRCVIGGYEKPNGAVVCYTIDELEDFTQAIDACRRALIDLNCFNYRLADGQAHARGSAVA